MHSRIGAICNAFNEGVASEGIRNPVVRKAPHKKELNMAMEVKNKRVSFYVTPLTLHDFVFTRKMKEIMIS